MNKPTELLDNALEKFAQFGPEVERSELTPLLLTSGAAPAARDSRFERGVSLGLDLIKSSSNGRTQALSLLWRLTSVSAMREHRKRVIAELGSGIPPLVDLPHEMSDPDDRRHFGDAMSVVPGTWVPEFTARAIVSEKDGEKARDSLARVLAANVPNLSEQLALVREAILSVRFEQQDPGAGLARRLSAILDSLGEAAWTADYEIVPGDNFGESLAGLVWDTVAKSQANERSASILAAGSVIKFAILAVRLHGTLAANAKSYSFLSPLRRSLGTSNWPNELETELSRLSGQILEQLVFLVRLKIPDAELRRTYLNVVGEVVGKNRLSRAADAAAGLDPEDAHWLRTGTMRRSLPTQTAIEETAVSAIDRDLGMALREAESVVSSIRAVSSEAVSAAEFHSKRLGEDLEALFHRVVRLVNNVEAASRRRNLTLKGHLGEIVEFSPMEHEPMSDAVGARTVRLKSKVVERIVDGVTAGIIVKGDVGAK